MSFPYRRRDFPTGFDQALRHAAPLDGPTVLSTCPSSWETAPRSEASPAVRHTFWHVYDEKPVPLQAIAWTSSRERALSCAAVFMVWISRHNVSQSKLHQAREN